ncbi:MAG: MATE family efflux transporter [Lachnospiraceae bacterium]|nr:MATE family efflux transporter [Lachnospiraceae bacterium]
MWKQFKEKFIGDKDFYKLVLMVATPMMIQNGITNFVSLLDNIMVGQLGTEQMSGVAIVNQLMMVFNISIFGAVSGASIFSAQFYGKGDHEGVRNAFRFKLVICLAFAALGITIFLTAGSSLIELYLNEGSAESIALTHQYGMQYLMVTILGIIPFTLSQVYASTLRETGETILPMIAGVIAVFVNLVFNYLLIFGHLGFPALGVVGAAVATLISRIVETIIVITWTHMHSAKNIFIQDAYRHFRIPGTLAKQILVKGTPLLINEALWSGGMATLTQCYSMRGLDAVAAINISSTVSNLFNVVFLALGSSIAIIVGQQLGSGELEKAVDTDRKLIFFSTVACFVMGLIMIVAAPVFPAIYNTTDVVKNYATGLIRIAALFMPLYSYYHATYFTLRSGGKTVVTFLFDSGYLWAIMVPVAFVLSRFTNIPLIPMYLICQCSEVFKAVVGTVLVVKKVWVNNIVEEM